VLAVLKAKYQEYSTQSVFENASNNKMVSGKGIDVPSMVEENSQQVSLYAKCKACLYESRLVDLQLS